MRTRHLFLTLMFIAGVLLPLPAQTISDEILQMFSPNAAELGKYGKIPVNYFNGLPTIEIPLTTLNTKSEGLPVFLTYYAGGHNPEQHPGWVGLGWTLRAGGCINRIINNRKDEISHDEIWNERAKPTIFSQGDLDTLSYFDYIEKGAVWAEDENAVKAHFRHNFYYGIWCDMEPDEFQINLGRIQASFYITGYNRETGQCTIRIKSRHPYDFSVKVFLSSTTGNHFDDRIKATLYQYISKIIITDSDGTRYTFGNDNGDLSSIEFSIAPTDLNCYGVASVSTWNLTKIEYPNNEVITLGYIKDGRPVVRTTLREGRALGYKIGKDFGNYLLDTSLPPYNSNGDVYMGSWNDYYLKSYNNDLSRWDRAMHVKLMYISPSYPASISASGTKDTILFHISKSSELEDLGTGENPYAFNLFKLKPYGKIPDAELQIEDILSENYYMRLDSISQGSKRISLSYGNNTRERLSLSSVRTSSGTNDGGLYSFEYNANKLPGRYCSGRSDRWGFHTNYYDTIPLPYHEIYARRAPDSTLMKAEILQKITYPTGGSTEYVFEPHTYSASVQRCDSPRIGFTVTDNVRDSIAGGLRIKRIINRDGEKEETRYFDYSKNNRSSGILSGAPVFFLRRDYLGKATVGRDGKSWIGSIFWKNEGAEVTLDLSYWIGCENYLNQLSTTDGNHVTYSNVTETYPDGGRTEYEYSNHKEALDASNEGDIISYSPENPDYILRRLYASHSLDRGLLSRKCCYDSENNLLEETIFGYNDSRDRFIDNVPVCQIRAESFPNLIQGNNASTTMSYLWTAGSRIYTYFPYLKRKEVISYSQEDGHPKKTTLLLDYKYDKHRRLIETVTKESDETEATEKIIYSGSENVHNSGVYQEMTEASVNMTGLPLEKIRYKDGKAIAAELTTYKKISTTNNSVNYVPQAVYSARLFEPSSSFLPYDGLTVGSHYGTPILKYSEYDEMCNPLEIIRDGNDLTSFVWGYQGAYPTAVFRNASRRKGEIVIHEPGLVSYSDDLRANTEHWFSYTFETSEEGNCDVYFDIPENVADFDFWVVIDNDVYFRPRTREWTDTGEDNEHSSEIYVEFMETLWLPDGAHKLTVTTLDPAIHPIPEGDDEQAIDLCFSYPVSPQTTIEVIPDDQHPAAGWFWIGYQGMAEREANGFIGDFYYEDFESGRGNSTLGFHSGKGYIGDYNVFLEVDPERLYYIDYRVYRNGKWSHKKYPYYGPSHTIKEDSAPIDEIRVYPADGVATTTAWFPNIGPRSVTDIRGINLSYEYDGLGRLTLCRDNDQSPTTGYSYHFSDGYDPTNYVRKTVYTEKDAAKEKIVTDFFDGLGRPFQTVREESADGKPTDIANLFEYDGNGRLSRSWLDTPVNGNNGRLVESDSLKDASTLFYGNATTIESRPFTENVYDSSPLNRVKTVFGAGQEWYESGKGLRTDWITNSVDNDILKCLKLKVTEYSDTSFTVNKSGYYPAGSLRVRKETDEDGNVAYLFSDLSERTILERRIASQKETADTYYVYDDFGDLRAVLPPMLSKEVRSSRSSRWSSESALFDRWAFLYVYDSRHQCVAKKTPGAGWGLTVYDRAGNAILTQNALQRARNEWSFSIPDGLGRICIQGCCEESSIFGDNTSIDIFSEPLEGITVRAKRSWNNTDDSDTSLGYEIDGLSINCSDALIVNYYDDYSFIGKYGFPINLAFDDTLVSEGFGDKWPSSLGMCTGMMVSAITTDDADEHPREYTVLFYDEYGRTVQAVSQASTGVRTRTASAFDFTGNNILSKEIVTTDTIKDTVDRHNTYDIWGRVKETSTTLSTKNGMCGANTIRYEYDRIGRLSGVVYGKDAVVNESVSYNVRGWLTDKQSEVFGMRLRYNTPVFESTPKWNGNISEWEWRFGDAEARAYSFSYDSLSRMTDSRAYTGVSAAPSNSFTERNISYDLNGNILTLDRYAESEATPEESAVFSYIGNHIWSVSEGRAFGYDRNGNITLDGRNGLRLTYNRLNLVGEIGDASGTLAKYTHLANGTKVSAERPDGSGVLYQGSLVYSKDGDGNLSLDRVLADGGHFVAEKDSTGIVTGYRFFHHLTDHLGSVRAVIDGDTGTVIETSDYYPFGKRIPLPVTEPVEVTDPTSQNRWHFSGKESQSFLSASIPLLDFGARMYDPLTARWTAQDPLAEKYYAVSPYAYCAGNPVINVDMDGQEIRFFEVSQYLGKTPEYQYSKIVEDANSGEYSILAYYDSDDNIVGYGASRNGRLEYVMDEANDYSAFIENLPNYSIAADFFYKNGIPSEGMIAMVAGDVSKGLAIQWMNSIKNPSYYLYVVNALATSSSSRNNLAAKARHLYPKKANKFEYHHIDPKYMGGDPSGPTVRIEASYHQMITNEFRRLHPYNKGKLPLEQREQIMKSVYGKYPIK